MSCHISVKNSSSSRKQRKRFPPISEAECAYAASAKDVLNGKSRNLGLAVPEKSSLLLVGSTVVVCPDEEGQAIDRQSKYNLGLNIGRIEAVNIADDMVQLWWYWGTAWNDSNWILWRAPQTKAAYKEWVAVDDLVCDEMKHIIRIEMEPVAKRRSEKFKLSKDSVREIKRCLQTNKGMLQCMKEQAEEELSGDSDSYE